MKLKKEDCWWGLITLLTLLFGLISLWGLDLSDTNPIMHIKIIYSILLTVAVFIAIYFIIFKIREKKNG